MLDKNDFAKLMLSMGEVFDKQVTEAQLDIYYEILQDYALEQIRKAFYSCLRTHKYNTLPKPADILEFLEGSKDDKALGAWLQLKEAVRKGGYYASIEFADPVIAHCVNELGGWQWFCCQLVEDLPFIEKRFMDLYRLYLKRGPVENIKLVGWIEMRNKELSHVDHIPKPLQIGFYKPVTYNPLPLSKNKKIETLIHTTAQAMKGEK